MSLAVCVECGNKYPLLRKKNPERCTCKGELKIMSLSKCLRCEHFDAKRLNSFDCGDKCLLFREFVPEMY